MVLFKLNVFLLSMFIGNKHCTSDAEQMAFLL